MTKSQAILKCFIDLKYSNWFTLDSEDETKSYNHHMPIKKSQAKCTENIDCRSFSVLKTLTGGRAEKSSKCYKTRFHSLSPM